MKAKWLICSLIFLSLRISLFSQSTERCTLEIRFTGIRNDIGLIAIGINTSPEGWPKSAEIELQWKKENMVDGELTVRVPDLPYGTMAISAMDDENSDLEMDMFLGLPREGYGFSMNPHTRLSSPKFDACSFQLNQAMQQLTIHLKYPGKDK